MPRIDGLLETALYVENPGKSLFFYRDLLGLQPIFSDHRIQALSVCDRQVLLLCKKGASADHDASGRQHIAFSVSKTSLRDWESLLKEKNIGIEQRKSWPRGGQSIYFRDPDGHLLELITPGTWEIF
jgi:catechol-2,3-dioxygenase